MNLLDIYKELNTEEKCHAFLEHMRWPEGVKCLGCNSARITRITACVNRCSMRYCVVSFLKAGMAIVFQSEGNCDERPAT